MKFTGKFGNVTHYILFLHAQKNHLKLTWRRMMWFQWNRKWILANIPWLQTWSMNLTEKSEIKLENCWSYKAILKSHLIETIPPFIFVSDPVQILTFSPSPLMEELPVVTVLWNLASSGMSKGCKGIWSFFFSQLWFLMSIS